MACWVTPNDYANSFCVWHGSSRSYASNSESSKIFSFLPPCRSSTSKSSLLKRWNHSRDALTKSSIIVSTWEHSMSLNRSFLQMKTENHNFPKMTRIWLENWHLRSRINLWCKHKFTNVCCRYVGTCPSLLCDIFDPPNSTSTYRCSHLS